MSRFEYSSQKLGIGNHPFTGVHGASGVAVLGDITEFPPHALELWGQICLSLALQPYCVAQKEKFGGFAHVKV